MFYLSYLNSKNLLYLSYFSNISRVYIWQPIQEKENSKFKPVKTRLKIDIVPHPTPVEESDIYGS